MESLGKEYSQREKNLKVLRAQPLEWDMKVVAMREFKDLSKITTFESNQVTESEDDQDELALFIKQFKKFVKGGRTTWKKGQSKPTTEGKDSKGTKKWKPGNFIKYCPYPETKKYTNDEKIARTERKRK
ncbi:hypothetical protein ACS0TY_029691 [Phlomoides rotata]